MTVNPHRKPKAASAKKAAKRLIGSKDSKLVHHQDPRAQHAPNPRDGPQTESARSTRHVSQW